MVTETIRQRAQTAEHFFEEGEYRKAHREYMRVLDLVNRDVDPLHRFDLWVDTNLKIIDALDMDGRWLDALMYVGTVLTTAMNSQNTKVAIKVSLKGGNILVKRGRWAEARTRFEQTLDMSKKVGAKEYVAESYLGLGVVSWKLGDTGEAKFNLKRALGITEETENLHLRGMTLVVLASVMDDTGESDAVPEMFREAIAALEQTNDWEELSRAHNNLGVYYEGIEEFEPAAREYESCVEAAAKGKNKRGQAFGMINAAECYARLGDLDTATDWICSAKELVEKLEDPLALALSHYVSGFIAAKKRDEDLYAREFQKALSGLGKLKIAHSIGVVSFEFGNALWSFGDKTNALEQFETSRKNFEKAGSKSQLEKVNRALSELRGQMSK